MQPIVISEELQRVVAQQSGLMTLPTNGIFDSYGPEFLRAVRPFVARGTTKNSVAVAALRAGWWPEKIWALMDKL
jgi:hypothetical protein